MKKTIDSYKYRFIRFFGSVIPQPLLKLFLKPYYDLSLLVLLHYLKKKDDLVAVYLAGSAARENLRYGISDLDFLIVTETDNCDLHKEIQDIIKSLRKFFLHFQSEDELAVFSREAMYSVIKYQRPDLLSIPGKLKLLWSKPDIDFSIPYQKEYEYFVLNITWQKLIMLQRNQSRSASYSKHILERVKDLLDGIEYRLGIRTEELPFSIEGQVCRLTQAFSKFLEDRIVSGIDDTHGRRFSLINAIFFETLSFNVLLTSKVRINPVVTCIAINPCSIFKQAQLPDADFILYQNVLYPLTYKSILTPVRNPLMFGQLRGDINSEAEILKIFFSRNSQEIPPFHAYRLKQITSNPEQLMLCIPENREFLSHLISCWRKIRV